jgi:hypothetical protein
VDALEKYGMPPLVPATVKAGVVVAVATETIPPVHPTEVTVPLPPATFSSSHPAAVTDVQAGAAVPAGALQTYSLCAVVSVNRSPGRFVATLPGAAVPKNFWATLVVSSAMVPVPVIVPPVIGPVVAMLVTVPDPPPLPPAGNDEAVAPLAPYPRIVPVPVPLEDVMTTRT